MWRRRLCALGAVSAVLIGLTGECSRAGVAHRSRDPHHRAVQRRQRHRHRRPHGRRASLGPARRSRSSSRKPPRRRQHDRGGRRRQGRSRRLHPPGCTPHRTWWWRRPIRTPAMTPRATSPGITALVSLPNVLVVAPRNTRRSRVPGRCREGGKPGTDGITPPPAPAAPAHLNGERFRLATGIDVQHIPYKGGPEGLTAVMTGDCDFYFIPLPAARGLVSAGKLAVLAVGGSTRSSALPEVPTTVEADHPTPNTISGSACSGAGQDAEGDRRQSSTRKP